MVRRAHVNSLLTHLGLTPVCAVVLLAYYAFYLTVEQFLPPGEVIFHSPTFFQMLIPTYTFTIMLYAAFHEVRHGHVPAFTRGFWLGILGLMLTATFYINFICSFGYAKSLIPVFNPYYLDPLLQKIDIALHAGYNPAHWLTGVLTPALQQQLNLFYLTSWGSTVTAYLLWYLASPLSASRTHFLSSFSMLWVIGGIVLATLCSSVGPLYYSLFYHDGYSTMNAALAQQLYGADNALVEGFTARQLLLDYQHNATVADFNGISAMPSMHTGTAMLLMLHSFHYARRLLILTVPFTVLMFLGSFTLGWHYAIDSYISAALVWIIWRVNQRSIRMAAEITSSR